MLKQADLLDLSDKARHKATMLLNDQGFAILSIVLSNLIAGVAEHPEKLVKEFGS